MEVSESRKQHVQDLEKCHIEAAEKYKTARERLAQSRDDSAFVHDFIMSGDLVMRFLINRKSKLYPK